MADSPHPPPLSPPSVPHSPPPDVELDTKPEIKPEVIAHATVVKPDGEVATKKEDPPSLSPAEIGPPTDHGSRLDQTVDLAPARIKDYLYDDE